MKNSSRYFSCLCMGVLLMANLASAQEDQQGSRDHPLLTRMPNFYINNFMEKDFDQYTIRDSQGREKAVEGRLYKIEYQIKDNVKEPSELQIRLNVINAIKTIGGSVVFEDPRELRRNVYLRVEKGGRVTWVHLRSKSGGAAYDLTIIEEKAMVQEVLADANTMASDIGAAGKVAIYGIYFDFNKSDVKPESDPTLKEITKLLAENSALRLYVVGHTDNVGEFNYNMKLSQARAEAVIKELVSKYKADGARLKALGVGPGAPVTSNKTEEGRAKNRRVELVEQ